MLWVLKRTVSLLANKANVEIDGLDIIFNFTLKTFVYLGDWACHVDYTPMPIISYHSLIKEASVFYFLYIFDSYLFIVQVCCKYFKYLY